MKSNQPRKTDADFDADGFCIYCKKPLARQDNDDWEQCEECEEI